MKLGSLGADESGNSGLATSKSGSQGGSARSLSLWEKVRMSHMHLRGTDKHKRSRRTLDLIKDEDFKTIESKALRVGVMERQFMDTDFVGWTHNYLVLSEDKLYIAHPTADGSRFGSLQRHLTAQRIAAENSAETADPALSARGKPKRTLSASGKGPPTSARHNACETMPAFASLQLCHKLCRCRPGCLRLPLPPSLSFPRYLPPSLSLPLTLPLSLSRHKHLTAHPRFHPCHALSSHSF
jgi:hypothetical protein